MALAHQDIDISICPPGQWQPWGHSWHPQAPCECFFLNMHSNGINDNLFLKINFADNQPCLVEGRSHYHDQTHHQPAIMLVGWMLSDELAHPVGVRVEFTCKVIFSLLWRSKKTSSSIWSTWSYQHYHQHHEHDRLRPHIIIINITLSYQMPVGWEVASSCWKDLKFRFELDNNRWLESFTF